MKAVGAPPRPFLPFGFGTPAPAALRVNDNDAADAEPTVHNISLLVIPHLFSEIW
jgi:hypothetical protein